MRILFIGDIIGKPGREAVPALVPGLRGEYDVDMVVANGENASGGFGITAETAQEIFEGSVDVITTGGHIWDRKEVEGYLDEEDCILWPLNVNNETGLAREIHRVDRLEGATTV